MTILQDKPVNEWRKRTNNITCATGRNTPHVTPTSKVQKRKYQSCNETDCYNRNRNAKVRTKYFRDVTHVTIDCQSLEWRVKIEEKQVINTKYKTSHGHIEDNNDDKGVEEQNSHICMIASQSHVQTIEEDEAEIVQDNAVGHIVHDVGKGWNVKNVVCWYGYAPTDVTIEQPEGIGAL